MVTHLTGGVLFVCGVPLAGVSSLNITGTLLGRVQSPANHRSWAHGSVGSRRISRIVPSGPGRAVAPDSRSVPELVFNQTKTAPGASRARSSLFPPVPNRT